MVTAGLGAGVGTRWIVRRIFVEAIGIIELEIAKNLVGTDVVQALTVLADGFQNGVGANDISLDERPGVTERVVVV